MKPRLDWRSALDLCASVGMTIAASLLVWTYLIWPWMVRRAIEHVDLPRDPVSIADAPVLGSPRARAALLEFSDFKCSFCARFSRETLPQIRREYIDTGRAALVSEALPLDDLHPFASDAARVGFCAAEQGRFWSIYDDFFAHQSALVDLSGIRTRAEAAGMDLRQLDWCLGRDDVSAQLKHQADWARTLGIHTTPTFLVGALESDGRVRVSRALVGARSYREIKAALEVVLESTGMPPR